MLKIFVVLFKPDKYPLQGWVKTMTWSHLNTLFNMVTKDLVRLLSVLCHDGIDATITKSYLYIEALIWKHKKLNKHRTSHKIPLPCFLPIRRTDLGKARNRF